MSALRFFDRDLGKHLAKDIATTGLTGIDICVSYVWPVAYDLLRENLRTVLPNSGSSPSSKIAIRIITTLQRGVTDADTLIKLAGLKDELSHLEIEVRVFSGQPTFHAKSWLFNYADGRQIAYIGSSNLSKSALTESVEWNLRIEAQKNHNCEEVVKVMRDRFREYWSANSTCKRFLHGNLTAVNPHDGGLWKQRQRDEDLRSRYGIVAPGGDTTLFDEAVRNHEELEAQTKQARRRVRELGAIPEHEKTPPDLVLSPTGHEVANEPKCETAVEEHNVAQRIANPGGASSQAPLFSIATTPDVQVGQKRPREEGSDAEIKDITAGSSDAVDPAKRFKIVHDPDAVASDTRAVDQPGRTIMSAEELLARVLPETEPPHPAEVTGAPNNVSTKGGPWDFSTSEEILDDLVNFIDTWDTSNIAPSVPGAKPSSSLQRIANSVKRTLMKRFACAIVEKQNVRARYVIERKGMAGLLNILLCYGHHHGWQDREGDAVLFSTLPRAARQCKDALNKSERSLWNKFILLLLQSGANPNLKDNTGTTALAYLARGCQSCYDTIGHRFDPRANFWKQPEFRWSGIHNENELKLQFFSVCNELVLKGANLDLLYGSQNRAQDRCEHIAIFWKRYALDTPSKRPKKNPHSHKWRPGRYTLEVHTSLVITGVFKKFTEPPEDRRKQYGHETRPRRERGRATFDVGAVRLARVGDQGPDAVKYRDLVGNGKVRRS